MAGYKYNNTGTFAKNKIRMIIAMGGKCALCGYDKCSAALCFHHCNPEEKEKNINLLVNCSWDRICYELKKCVMLCANCHLEIHLKGSKTNEIKMQPNFISKYESLEAVNKAANIKPYIRKEHCVLCGKKRNQSKNNKSSFCSIDCRNEFRKQTGRRYNWEGIDLLEMTKTMTHPEIAATLGIGLVSIDRKLKQLRAQQ
jgi:hypothetical protein